MAKTKTKAWYLGNTSVRSPLRLADALRVIVDSEFDGNMGRDMEEDFGVFLHERQVVRIAALTETGGTSDIPSLGRKWRSALMQLGFITPDPSKLKSLGISIQPYQVTDSGRRLATANSIPQKQECFLRSLVVQRVPTPIEPIGIKPTRPLIVTLQLLLAMEEEALAPSLNRDEIAFGLQLLNDESGIPSAIERILEIRETRAKSNRREFSNYLDQLYSKLHIDGQSFRTFTKDYPDSNSRYLRATGLFVSSSRNLKLDQSKRSVIEQIAHHSASPTDLAEYAHMLWAGGELPYDNKQIATQAVLDLDKAISDENSAIESVESLSSMNAAELNQLRYELEETLAHQREQAYAQEQINQSNEIASDLLQFTSPDSNMRRSREAPALFEWSIWRAFLAINHLSTEPWESRGFEIDPTDFSPVGFAPSRIPDMVFEFEDFVIVCEVTLSASSTQEAMEGESVRRHVARVKKAHKKPVLGLFVAVSVDTNTIDAFHRGIYWEGEEELMVDITPLTLEQFVELFEFVLIRPEPHKLVGRYLKDTLLKKGSNAMSWRRNLAAFHQQTVRP